MSCRLCSPAFFTYSIFHPTAGSHGVCNDPVCICTVDNRLFSQFCLSHLQSTKFFVPFRYIHISLWLFIVGLQMCDVWMWDVCEERTSWSYLRVHFNFLKPKTLCTTSFNIQKFCVLPTMHLCVLRGSQNKKRLFLFTALTYRLLSSKQRVFTARYELGL